MRVDEVEALSHAVADFDEAMRQKLWKKLREGYGGWSDSSDPDLVDTLREKLEDHVARYLGVSFVALRRVVGWLECFVGAWNETKDVRKAAWAGLEEGTCDDGMQRSGLG